jgi:hypothetical protein
MLLVAAPRPAAGQTPIACDQPGSGIIAAAGQHDTYVFSANAGEKVIIAAVASSGTLRAHLQLLDPDQLFVGDNGFYNDATGNLGLSKTGIYTIIVSDYGSTATGGYSVYLQFTTPGRCGPAFTCGQTVTGSIASVAGMDSYHFSGNAGERSSSPLWRRLERSARIWKSTGLRACL